MFIIQFNLLRFASVFLIIISAIGLAGSPDIISVPKGWSGVHIPIHKLIPLMSLYFICLNIVSTF